MLSTSSVCPRPPRARPSPPPQPCPDAPPPAPPFSAVAVVAAAAALALVAASPATAAPALRALSPTPASSATLLDDAAFALAGRLDLTKVTPPVGTGTSSKAAAVPAKKTPALKASTAAAVALGAKAPAPAAKAAKPPAPALRPPSSSSSSSKIRQVAPPPPALARLLGGGRGGSSSGATTTPSPPPPTKTLKEVATEARSAAAADRAADAAARATKAAAKAQAEADTAAARATAARSRTTQLVTTGAAAVGGFALAKASAAGALLFRNLGGPSLLAATLRSPGALFGRTLRVIEWDPLTEPGGPLTSPVSSLPRSRVATVEGLRKAIARAARCEPGEVRQVAHWVPAPSGAGSAAFPPAFEPITGPASFAGLPDPAWIVFCRRSRSRPEDRIPARAASMGGGPDAAATVAAVVSASEGEADAAALAAAAAAAPGPYQALVGGMGGRPREEVLEAMRALVRARADIVNLQ